jgi:hypothetical protein
VRLLAFRALVFGAICSVLNCTQNKRTREPQASGEAKGKAELLLRLLGLRFGTLPEANGGATARGMPGRRLHEQSLRPSRAATVAKRCDRQSGRSRKILPRGPQ